MKVYKGYVDDDRNTDNAWIETVALHFHDETREILGDLEFEVCNKILLENVYKAHSFSELRSWKT